MANNVLFIDEDGDPLVFDPDILPSGITLTMNFTNILLPSDSKKEDKVLKFTPDMLHVRKNPSCPHGPQQNILACAAVVKNCSNVDNYVKMIKPY